MGGRDREPRPAETLRALIGPSFTWRWRGLVPVIRSGLSAALPLGVSAACPVCGGLCAGGPLGFLGCLPAASTLPPAACPRRDGAVAVMGALLSMSLLDVMGALSIPVDMRAACPRVRCPSW
jgi:hypothetical protein